MDKSKSLLIQYLQREDKLQMVTDPLTNEKMTLKRFLEVADRRSRENIEIVYKSLLPTY